MTTERPCILCGKQTKGSVGAAGIKWPYICQPCKDEEDEIARLRLKAMAKAFDVVTGNDKTC